MEVSFNRVNIVNTKQNPPSSNEAKMDSPTSCTDFVSIYGDLGSDRVRNLFKNYSVRQSSIGYKEIKTFDAPYLGKGHIYQLDNGQKVVIIHKQGPTTINTFVKVGSFNEPERLRGISHYIEHNLFNGSSEFKYGEVEKLLNDMGAESNAATDTNYTNYYIKLPLINKEDLEKAISIQANMLQKPTFSREQLEKEKQIVIDEINEKKDENSINPENISIKNLFNIDFDNNMVAGSEERIRNFTKQDVLDYYNTWYTPDNMTTVIVGNVDPSETIKLVSQYFKQPKKPGYPEKRFYTLLNNQLENTKRVDIKYKEKNLTSLNMAFVGPKNNDLKENVATDALMELMEGHKFSRLNKIFDPSSTYIKMNSSIISPYINDPTVIKLNVLFGHGEEEKGLQDIYNALYYVAQNPISDKELELVKTSLGKTSEKSKDLTDTIGESIVNNGSIEAYSDYNKMVDALTPADIQNAAKKYLDLNRVSIVMAHPDKNIDNEKTVADKNISFKGQNLSYNMDDVKEYELPNNIHLVIDSSPGITSTSVRFVISAKNMPKTKAGVSFILDGMLNKSSQKYSKDELSEIIESNGLDMEVGANINHLIGRINCSSDNTLLAVNLLKEMLCHPNFTQERLNELKKVNNDIFKDMANSPDDRMDKELYGNNSDHFSSGELMKNNDNITINDVQDLYNQIISNSHATVVLTIPKEDLQKIKGELFGSLSKDTPVFHQYQYVNNYDPIYAKPLEKTKIYIDTRDSDQAYITQTFKIPINGNIKDETTLALLNIILGGNNQSRLYKNLREKQQLSYSPYSEYSSGDNIGKLELKIETTAKDQVQVNDNLKKSIEGFRENINDLIKNPVSPEELNSAKVALKSVIINDLETSSDRNSYLETGLESPYGINYINEKLKVIDTITPTDIQKAAILYLDKPSLIYIVASKDTLDSNKQYISSIGDVVQ